MNAIQMDQVMARVQGLIKKFLASAMSQAESSPSVVPRHGLFQEHGFEAGREKIELVPLLKHGHKVIHMEVVDVSWSSLKVLHESGTVLSGASLCIGLLDRQQLRQRGWWKQDLGVKRVNWFASFLFKVQASTSS